MKVLIAPDKFKDALSAKTACEAIEEGLLLANPSIETHLFPMADGGEGTADILTYNTGGRIVSTTVHDPLFRKVKAKYGLSADGETAYIEMAQASGLSLLKPDERNCLLTSTYGTGELIKDAIEKGATRIMLGLGGSATNDAGIGMAAALGYRFYDKDGIELAAIGRNLKKIESIDDACVVALDQIEFLIACDVENPLYGNHGAAYVYAPQKGADEEAIVLLNKGLEDFAALVNRQYHIDLQSIKGAGAAGGLGAGAVLFLKGKLISGVDLIMQLCDFESKLNGIDLIVTGEGKIDQQSLSGKLIKGIINKAKIHHIPVVALCGSLTLDEKDITKLGLSYAASIVRKPYTLEEALKNTYFDLKHAAFNVGKLLSL